MGVLPTLITSPSNEKGRNGARSFVPHSDLFHCHGVVVLAGGYQERATLGILRVDQGLRLRVGIGAGRLEERHVGAGHRVRLVQRMRFVFLYGVGEGETKLPVAQRDGASVVEGVARQLDGAIGALSGFRAFLAQVNHPSRRSDFQESHATNC